MLYNEPTVFRMHHNEFSTKSQKNVIYTTPDYPEKSVGMLLTLEPSKLILYHFEFISGYCY
jgi:hypothetical protein